MSPPAIQLLVRDRFFCEVIYWLRIENKYDLKQGVLWQLGTS